MSDTSIPHRGNDYSRDIVGALVPRDPKAHPHFRGQIAEPRLTCVWKTSSTVSNIYGRTHAVFAAFRLSWSIPQAGEQYRALVMHGTGGGCLSGTGCASALYLLTVVALLSRGRKLSYFRHYTILVQPTLAVPGWETYCYMA